MQTPPPPKKKGRHPRRHGASTDAGLPWAASGASAGGGIPSLPSVVRGLSAGLMRQTELCIQFTSAHFRLLDSECKGLCLPADETARGHEHKKCPWSWNGSVHTRRHTAHSV